MGHGILSNSSIRLKQNVRVARGSEHFWKMSRMYSNEKAPLVSYSRTRRFRGTVMTLKMSDLSYGTCYKKMIKTGKTALEAKWFQPSPLCCCNHRRCSSLFECSTGTRYHLCTVILTSRLLRMWLTCVFSHPSVWFGAGNAFISPNAAYPAPVSSRPGVVSHACGLISCKFDEGVNTRLSPDQKTSLRWCVSSKSQLPSALWDKLIRQGMWRASGKKKKKTWEAEAAGLGSTFTTA